MFEFSRADNVFQVKAKSILSRFLTHGAWTGLILGFVLTACVNPSQIGTATAHIGERTKTSGCRSNGPLPDSGCTPGAIINTATREQICQSGYAKNVRNVPNQVKDEAYAEYGVQSRSPGEYEVDHLISLELGGSNAIANLWPEPANPRPGFHEKDQVENYLHDQICSNAITLDQAQNEIASDWINVYNRMPKK
jgi:hypothetical protein